MTRRDIGLWAPPVVLMAVIWFLSSQPDLSTGLGALDLIGRKLLHAAEYALLSILWFRALESHVSTRAALAAAFLIATGYAAIDEYHQTFVAGRNGSPVDVAIDATGAAIAVLLLRRREAVRLEAPATVSRSP
jgi:VanZ family protein